MQKWLLFFFLPLAGILAFLTVLLFFPLEVKAPYVQHFFLPKNEDRDEPLPTPEIVAEPATILFTGDIMMARTVESTIKASGADYPLSSITDILKDADLTVGNFEGTIREKERIEKVNELDFDTVPANADILKNAGFDLVSLANNHADDFGSDVTTFTRETLEEHGLHTFGDALMSENFVAHEVINGRSFAFIGFHAFLETPESLFETIQAEKTDGNFVIVFPHWGNEYETDPYISQVVAAHEFIDAGADLVVGAHPHVIQPVEMYKGVPIFYSLGNFLFDQDWSAATKKGLTVKVAVTDENLTFTLLPVTLLNAQTKVADEKTRSEILEFLGYPTGTFTVPRP